MRVEIFDQSYHIQGQVDEAYMEELARFVDDKLRLIAASSRSMDLQRVAVLAALNIADELFTQRKRATALESSIRPRAERALAAIDQALKESS